MVLISLLMLAIDTTQVTAGNSCHEYFINRDNIDLVKDKYIKKVLYV